MRITRLSPETGLFANGRPITHEGGSTAVLLLHGWTGWTGRLAYLAERLAEQGYTVRLPRLPGHGSTLADFRECTWKDWLRRAVDEYLDLQDRSERVYVAGASMGALLAIILAAQFDIQRIALLAPALHTRNRLIVLAPVLRYIVPRFGCDWSAERDPDPDAGPIGQEYKSHNYTATIAQLYRLQLLARKSLRRLNSETLAVISEADETVPPSVANYLSRELGEEQLRTLLLKESGHQMVQGSEREVVCDAVLDWFADRK